MRKIKLLTDSTCDVTSVNGQDGMKLYDMDFISLYVNLGDQIYKDAEDMTTEKLLSICESNKITPKTSAPSIEDFVQFFKKYVDQDYDVIYMGIGSKLSGTYQSARLAAQEFEEGRVTVIDSNSLTSACGLAMIRAAEYRDSGKSVEEIATFLRETVDKCKCSFVIDTLEYLHRGGRCSSMAYVVGTALRLKPLIGLNDGKLDVTAKLIGKKISMNVMIKNFKKDLDENNVLTDKVLITHTHAYEDVPYIKSKLIEMGIKEESILVTDANCVVCSHCGRKTIGIIYTTK